MLLNNVKYYWKGLDNNANFIQNSSDIMINLNDAKVFSYSVNDNSFSIEPKEFDLTFTCKTKALADDVVTKLMYSTIIGKKAKLGDAVLMVDGWFIDTNCTGITAIDADEYGVTQFTAHFYCSKGFKWYSVINTIVRIDSDGNGFCAADAYSGERTWRIRVEVPNRGTGGSIILGTSASTTSNYGYCTYTSPSYIHLVLDGHNKIFKNGTGYGLESLTSDLISKVTRYNNMFLKFVDDGSSRSNFGIYVTNATANTTMYVREYRYREMPLWTTT